MTVRETIVARLEASLHPTSLVVVDQSAQHAGHAGARPEGETHFLVEIASAAFIGKRHLERHRLVTGILADLLETRVHALSIKATLPENGGQG